MSATKIIVYKKPVSCGRDCPYCKEKVVYVPGCEEYIGTIQCILGKQYEDCPLVDIRDIGTNSFVDLV